MSIKTNFNNKTVLVTGGAGFIGSNIAKNIQKHYPDCQVIIFDKFRNNQVFENGNPVSYGHYNNLIGFNGEIICGDISSKKDVSLLNDFKIDYIFHQAAISDTRVDDQSIVMQTNVNSFYDIIDLAKRNDALLVYASSGAVYGSQNSPQKVGFESPENPYGYSKYAMDLIAKKYINTNDYNKIFGLRYFNVYGPGEFYKDKTSSMIIQLGHQILSSQSAGLFIGSDKIFRDFIYIDDVVKANFLCTYSQNPGIYNIGKGVAESFESIVKYLKEHLGDCKINYFENPYKKGYQFHTQAEIKDSLNGIGFDPKINLKEGIKKYIPFIKKTHQKLMND